MLTDAHESFHDCVASSLIAFMWILRGGGVSPARWNRGRVRPSRSEGAGEGSHCLDDRVGGDVAQETQSRASSRVARDTSAGLGEVGEDGSDDFGAGRVGLELL